MALALFCLGLLACAAGLWTILAREYQQALRGLAGQSDKLRARSLTEIGVAPVLDASARLLDATTALIRTAMGVGAFLCLLGLALCLVGYWMFVA
jgi:hypothetical protein